MHVVPFLAVKMARDRSILVKNKIKINDENFSKARVSHKALVGEY